MCWPLSGYHVGSCAWPERGGYLIGSRSRDPEPMEISNPFRHEDGRRAGSRRYPSAQLRGLLPRHDQSPLGVLGAVSLAIGALERCAEVEIGGEM